MDAEFHYWITGILAHSSGFSEDETRIIAYSSQHVDDNTLGLSVDPGGPDQFSVFISQTYDILKPKKALMRIYPFFHFVPGEPAADSAKRTDCSMHLLNTTPNNRTANKLLDSALETGDPYRIGIAAHAYADTWAHQNFVGWYTHFNAIGGNVLPNIGHADALTHPDRVRFSWEDDRLVTRSVNNGNRFMDAAGNIFRKFSEFNSSRGSSAKRASWDTVRDTLRIIMDEEKEGRRIESYKNQLPWLGDYDKVQWLMEAVHVKGRWLRGIRRLKIPFLSSLSLFRDNYSWKDPAGFEQTDWWEPLKFAKKVFNWVFIPLKIIFTRNTQ